ncbi:protein-disulfide reductase DsbD family protein [Lignipirellula cremea]|uniref:Thiol:disulfide interchange protein DsbD n=1 Tax=Lignipirellula cremea TaxID=2528010 RepID=A0A518E104_9BACT|nr:cytochrome c biogenesis protein CcdA [Lignipirellula cremea]QDU97779.1 Thiol:disulfide interchange protein DsbD precursor [Lignipirellula cremea]
MPSQKLWRRFLLTVLVLFLLPTAVRPLAGQESTGLQLDFPALGGADKGGHEGSFMGSLGGANALGGAMSSRPPITLSASFQMEEGTRNGKVEVCADISEGWHAYAISQPQIKDGEQGAAPKATEIELRTDPPGLAKILLSGFKPDVAPKVSPPVEPFTVNIEEHHGKVVWIASFELADGVDPKELQLFVDLEGQVCSDPEFQGANAGCQLFPVSTLQAKFHGEYPRETGWVTLKSSHIKWRAIVAPTVVAPGDKVTVVFDAFPREGYHVYDLAKTDPDLVGVNKPTLIVFNESLGPVPNPIVEGQLISHPSKLPNAPEVRYFEKGVRWRYTFTVPSGMKKGERRITGLLGFQTCTENGCDRPDALEFETLITIGDKSNKEPQYFSLSPSSYQLVAEKAESKNITSEKVAFSFMLAFLGGIVLNFMPCVLPVIGLKVMSFVQQAGQKRGQILALNLWYTLGIVTVFWGFAAAAISLRLVYGETLAWGNQFSNPAFTIPLASVVFIFGLSLLGVWEIPLPGFVGNGKTGELAAKEGASGAFFKGVLATLLATPCTGPFFATAIGFAVAAPPVTALIAFTLMGLGMATPYLVLGFFPSLVNALPRPGNWMVTFKQVTGFILMATVVWFFTFLDESYVGSLLWLLLSLSIGCWMIGDMGYSATIRRKAMTWMSAGAMNVAVVLLVFFGAWGWFFPSYELEWQPFSRDKIQAEVASGKAVMVDFTADWCQTCKMNERLVLNTKLIKDAVEERGVVTLKADKTSSISSEAIDSLLQELGNVDKGIPFLAIYPAGGGKPILMKGQIYQQSVLSALEQASAAPATEAVKPTTDETAMNSP